MIDCLNTPGPDLDGIRSRVGSVQGSMAVAAMTDRFRDRLHVVVFDDLPALLKEVDRLRKLESGMRLDVARNYKMMDTLLVDYRTALDADREMAANQISEHRGRLAVENKVLEKILNG